MYHTKNSWFNGPIFSDWFYEHFVSEVQHYLENVLCIVPEEGKPLLLLDNAHTDQEKLVSADGKVRTMCLTHCTTSIIQPMDLK